MTIKAEYARQRLLFFVAQDVTDPVRNRMKTLVESLSNKRSWQIAVPKFIDSIDYSGTSEADFPDETVGCMAEVYAASKGELPASLDAQALAEVELLVKVAQDFSRTYSLEIEFELDGVFVGAIDRGALDKSLEHGLLGEWRAHLTI